MADPAVTRFYQDMRQFASQLVEQNPPPASPHLSLEELFATAWLGQGQLPADPLK